VVAKILFGALDEMATNWILSKRRYKLAPMADQVLGHFSQRSKGDVKSAAEYMDLRAASVGAAHLRPRTNPLRWSTFSESRAHTSDRIR
jgi:hypothetical protein